MSSIKTLSFRPLSKAKGGGTCSRRAGDGHLRKPALSLAEGAGQAQRGQDFRRQPYRAEFRRQRIFLLYRHRGRRDRTHLCWLNEVSAMEE
jgi:hypothetical protein